MLDRKHVMQRFQSEFRAARKLFHPNLVRALDFGFEQGLAYLVLEYIPGRSLFEMMREKLRLPEADAVRFIRQTAQGLKIFNRHVKAIPEVFFHERDQVFEKRFLLFIDELLPK